MRPAHVRLHLENNHFQAGRVASFCGVPAPVEVHADRNDFSFRQAVLSFTGSADKVAWQKTAWHGHNNTYHGASDWLCVDGSPAGIRGLAAWQSCWGEEEPGSLE